ncbi:MAG: Omp28 family outer membrane lipoprotein [Prevotella sp.]|nr:Omp28 family outer membrane lipoprotein [Prevotella sp.]
MKLKNIIYCLALSAATLIAVSCSNIDEDEREIYVKPAEMAKHVLIEDFTGQRCVNCPAATAIIEQLQEQYGTDNVIAVGIYSGPFGASANGSLLPLTTETGNYYYNTFGVSEQPSALIDRHSVNSNTATWAAEVYNYIQETSPLILDVTNSYDEATRTVSITVEGTAIESVSGKLQVWLIEDNIVSTQYLSDGSFDNNYVHNHVFRTTVNDKDGESFAVAEAGSAMRTYTATLDADWKAEDMSVVAFVFDGTGVLQTVKAAVIDNQSDVDDGEVEDE